MEGGRGYCWHGTDGGTAPLSLQAKELLDHLEGVLSNEPIEVRVARALDSRFT